MRKITHLLNTQMKGKRLLWGISFFIMMDQPTAWCHGMVKSTTFCLSESIWKGPRPISAKDKFSLHSYIVYIMYTVCKYTEAPPL